MLKVKFRKHSDLHLLRKLWHCLRVLTILLLYYVLEKGAALQLAALTTFAFVLMDILRQNFRPLNDLLLKFFGVIMRRSEKHRLAGTTFLFVGVLLLILLFPRPVVILSLLFLAFADPVASAIGVLYGKDRLIGRKTLQGSAAAFVVCFLLSAIYFLTNELMLERWFVVSILCGLSGALAELIPIGKLDDNFTFPLLSALSLWLLFQVFGGF